MKKGKNKTKMVVIIVCIVIMVLVLGGFLFFFVKSEESKRRDKEIKLLVKDIKSHYNKYVKTLRESNIYKKVDGGYKAIGKVSSGVELTLHKSKIDKNTKYFAIDKLGCYIKYKDVSKIDSLSKVDDRYKRYIVFDENVRSKNGFKLYKDDR